MGDSNVLSKVFIVPEGAVVVPDRFDRRVIDKNLSLGRVTKKELDEHLAALEDCSQSAKVLNYSELVSDDYVDDGSSDFKETKNQEQGNGESVGF